MKPARSSLRARWALAAIGTAAAAVLPVLAWVQTEAKATWPAGSIPLQFKLGPSATLIDGGSWESNAAAAAETWNSNMGSVQFTWTSSSEIAGGARNNANELFFAAKPYNSEWGSHTLAITTYWYSGNSIREADVLFNTNETWNAYRGPVRPAGNGYAIPEFRRVAIHELGHALGLSHPDDAGQSVSAIMNAAMSSIDTVTADDTTGIATLYGPGSGNQGEPPAITWHPQSFTTTVGEYVSFNVTATGTAPLQYQWRRNGTAIPGAIYAVYTIQSVKQTDAGDYTVAVSNTAGSVVSNVAKLTVNPATAPTFASQPTGVTCLLGSAFNLSYSSADRVDSIRWYRNGVAIPGATASVYSVAAATVGDGGTYTVVITNAGGSTTSSPAVVTVLDSTVAITDQPRPIDDYAGATVSLSVGVIASAPVSYQWFRNGVAVPGAVNSIHTIYGLDASTAGTYTVRVSTATHSATSAAARVTLKGTASRFYALATRAVVGAGADVLIPGLAVTGSAPKKVLIRALGPELGKRNVSGFLADPTLNLLTLAGQSLATSDDWDHTNPEYRAAFTQVGLTDLPNGSKDAVLIATLPPGLYTPVIAGKNGGTGVALVEFYDLDPNNGTLAAISTRAMVGTGADVLIPGIVIDGNAPKKLLVRVAGPELLSRNINNALLDPTFELKDINGTTLLTNDNWDNNDAALIAATTAVGAPPFKSASKDAALLATLQPGVYTIVIKGVNNTSGVALVELFDVP